MDDATLETVLPAVAKLIMTISKLFRFDIVRDAFRIWPPFRVPERLAKCDLNTAAVRTASLFYLATYYSCSMASFLVGAGPDLGFVLTTGASVIGADTPWRLAATNQ